MGETGETGGLCASPGPAVKGPVVRAGTGLKQRRTRTRLTAAARTLTIEHGLAGFTVLELCEQVGVSRRTFFNYFPSKEHAVLGFAHGASERHVAAFMAARTSGPAPTSGPASNLIADLAALAEASFGDLGLTAADAAALAAALRREPALLPLLLDAAQREQERFVVMVAEREGQGSDRVTAEVAVKVVGCLVGLAAETFLTEANTTPFSVLLRARLVSASALFARPADTPFTPPALPLTKDPVRTP
ncbi:TetR/AcrR family transcriptional regulator [Subtercola boreus]|nr:TetR/AcrR family transcriptional regulator [Subtercola boreus]